jgi:hypothetical protein
MRLTCGCSRFQAAVAPLFSYVYVVLLPPVSVTLLLCFLFCFGRLASLFLVPFLTVAGLLSMVAQGSSCGGDEEGSQWWWCC